MNQSKIIIELNGANNPPKVFVDGEEVKVVSLNYQYSTSSNYTHSINNLDLLIPNVVDGSWGVKKMGFENRCK